MIRRAVADDASAIAALFRRSFDTLTFLPSLHTKEEDVVFFGAVVEEQEVWVWDDDGRVLGFAALGDTMLNHLYVDLVGARNEEREPDVLFEGHPD